MKTIACTVFLALFVINLAMPRSTSARVSGPSASGTCKFVLEDELTKTVDFSVSTDERGTTTGQLTFKDEAGTGPQDPDGVGDPKEGPPSEFYMTAELDSLTIENNRALMGGTIRDSSDRSYIGRWVQLVVEDNGDGREVPDKLSWRFCEPAPGGWTPSDAEDPRDEGAWWHWWATDAERDDDRGVQSTNIIPGSSQGCATFPLSTYEFPDARGESQIQVLP